MSGFEKVRATYPDTPAAMISGIAEADDVMQAFDLGAVGYFPKTMSGKALLQAIKLVLAGERFVPMDHNNNAIMPSYYDDGDNKAGQASSKIYAGMHEKQSSFHVSNDQNKDFKLTPRETEVLSHLMHGTSNKEIATTLGLQVVTVKLHVRGICRKLEVKNRTQAALKAREFGLAEST
jgi:two-component system nitrate/nitrite response regulator NarL